jgi:hypothetical protein
MVGFFADLIGARVAAVCRASCVALYWTAYYFCRFFQPDAASGSTYEETANRKLCPGGHIGVVNFNHRIGVCISISGYFLLDYYRNDEKERYTGARPIVHMDYVGGWRAIRDNVVNSDSASACLDLAFNEHSQ